MKENYVTVIDIGNTTIKVLTAETKISNEITDAFTLPYRQLETDGNYDYETNKLIYFQNFESIVKALEVIKSRIPPESEIRYLFNSLFSKIVIKKLTCTATRKISAFAQVYMKKISNQGMISDFRILEVDDIKKNTEILIYAYEKNIFSDFLNIAGNQEIQPESVEFDLLTLANGFLENNPDGGDYLIIEIGGSKTMIISIKENKIHDFDIIRIGTIQLYQKISQKYNVSMDAAEKMLVGGAIQHTCWEPLLSELAKVCILKTKKSTDPKIFLSGGLAGNRVIKRLLSSLLNFDINEYCPFVVNDKLDANIKSSVFAAAYGALID